MLNAQEQWYRIKALRYQGSGGWGSTTNYDFTTDMYLNINNYDAHADGPIGGVSVASYSESLDQIFTLEDNGDGTYYIKSASGKYIYCQSWNVDALDTKSPIGIEYVDANTFYMKNASQYFKVEYVSPTYYPFCDYPNATYAATWVLEEATIEYTVNVLASSNEIWSDETVQLSATAINGAGNYSYSWSPATGLDNAESATPIFTPTAAGTYTFTCTATDADGNTATSEEITITVKDASEKPKTRNIVITLGDPGYGDGWNGNKLSISYEGFYEELTLVSGSAITYEREMPQGVEVTLTYTTDGQWYYPQENSFEIKYAEGEVIWSKGQGELSANISYTFTVESTDPSVTIDLDPATVALGDVRMGDYWTEKDQKSEQFGVVVKYTTITGVSCDNELFVVEYDGVNSVVNVGYNTNASSTGNQTGTITITAENCDPVTVTVTATAYTATEPDAIEVFTTIEFTDGEYTNTPTFTNLHDDYKLPGEKNEGETPDAVYKFSLENETVLTATVTGTNGIAAIYKAEDLEDNGPSSDNNYKGIVQEANPVEMDIIIGEENAFTNGYLPSNEYYNYAISQQIYTANEINASEGTISSIAFKQGTTYDKTRNLAVYMLNTAQSTFEGTLSWVTLSSENLVFSDNITYPSVAGEWAEISLQTPFEYTGGNLLVCVVDNTGTYSADVEFYTYETSERRAIYTQRDDYTPFDVTNMGGITGANTINYQKVVNTIKFHGEFVSNAKSVAVRSVEPQINSVVYPAGEYYLVAAAEDEFTVTLSAETVPAPAAFAYTSPENNAMEQDNPKLTWEASEYATSYKVYMGTELPLTEYVTVEELSYQTENLQDNTKYYWSVTAVNETSETAGEVYSFVTPLNKPTELAATATNLYPGDETTISWTAADGATGYNVYVNDVKVNEEPITETSYELTELSYNMNPGNAISVAAIHTLGESPKCEAVYVKVAGEFTLVVNVTDAEGNALEGAAVAFNTEEYYDEYYQLVPAVETLYTDENGQITQVLPLPCVYGDPNWQYAQMTVTVSKEYANDSYISINSYTGITNGQEYVQNVTLSYVAPQNIQLDDYYNQYVVGEEMTMTWDAVDGAIGYNVYERGEWNDETSAFDYTLLTTESLTEETFTVELTEYEPYYGLVYAVAAVYSFGESPKTEKYVYVTGESQILAVVKNANDEALKGAIVTLVGKDDFDNDKTYEFTTDANGAITEEVVFVGTYTAKISHYDYEDYITNEFIVEYGTPYDLGTITLTARTEATIAVTATEAADGSKVDVSWEAEYEKYNVYRRNVETGEYVKIASDVTLNEYEATDWTTLENGTYQYGVSAVVEQNFDYSEGFENGIPSTWAVYNARGAASIYDWTTAENHANLASYDGTYAAYAKSSKSGDASLDYYYMVTDLIDLSDLTNVELSFAYFTPDYYYYSTPQNNYTNTLKVKILTEGDGQNSATPSVSYLWTSNMTHTGNWIVKTLDLSSYAGQKIYVAFENYPYYGACSSVDAVKVSSYMSVESAVVWSEPIEKIVAEFTNAAEDNNWHNAANWSTGAVPTAENNVTIAAAAVISSQDAVAKNITIASGASVTVNADRKLTAQNIYNTGYAHSQLIINDGAQVIQNNEGVLATFNMGIVNPETWGVSSDGWQFIAVPFTDAAFDNFTGFMATNYDLFKYDGEAEDEWQNHKDNVGFGDAGFVNGRAYLASHENKETATIYGTLNSAMTHTYTVTFNTEKDLANYHLLGNPFSFNMDWSNITVEGVYNGFATVDSADGSYDYSTTGTVNVGDGFFVRATAENPTISYGAAKRGYEKYESINLIATGANGDDNAIINFADADEEGFLKLDNFNAEIANIYFSNSGRRYAISNFDREVTEIPVSFDAKQMGSYTIAAQPQGKFESVILVDRFTGVETDLLTDSYTFTATGSENHDRFIVKLANSQEPTANSNFAYVSGEDLIINAEGTVQIIDMMGRVVYSDDVESTNNRINVSDFDNAAYVIRVVNENGVKVQKIIL